MNKKLSLTVGALFSGLGVLIGAFGAHGLKPDLLAHQTVDTFETAVRYQMYHGLALLLYGAIVNTNPNQLLRWSSISWVAGVLLFSGSLYAYALSGVRTIAIITPFGGLAFLIGWLLFAIGQWQTKMRSDG